MGSLLSDVLAARNMKMGWDKHGRWPVAELYTLAQAKYLSIQRYVDPLGNLDCTDFLFYSLQQY